MHDDHEAMMARAELYKAAKYAMKLFKMIREGDELEGWVSAKITKAADYLDSVAHYMEYHQEVKHEFEALDYKGGLREALDRTLVEAKKKVEMKKKLEKKKAEIDESLNENDDAIKAHEKQGRRVKKHSDGSYTWYDDKEKIARKVKKGGKGGESVKYTPKGKKEDDPDLDESAKYAKNKKVKESSNLEVDPEDKDLEVKKKDGKTTVTSKTGRVNAVMNKDKIKVASGK